MEEPAPAKERNMTPPTSLSTDASAKRGKAQDAPLQASGGASATSDHAATPSGNPCSPLLSLPTDVIPLHILPNLNASSALNFGLTSKAALPFFDDERHFQAALRRDFPEAAATAANEIITTDTNFGSAAKEEYYLQLSIMCGYDPRWYRLSTLGNDVAKSRQGFGKTVLLGHPVVFGGWATDSRGFFDIQLDVVYLSEHSMSRAMDTAQYQWKKLIISSPGDFFQYATYCTAAVGVDDVPLSQLVNINGFAEHAQARGWDIADDATFPVLFVSGGVAEGAYRCATSFLHAIIGGKRKRDETDNESNENSGDNMAAYDWCRLEICGGVFDEIPANERSLVEARRAVPDAIPTGASSNDGAITSSPAKFGGSSRAGHALFYDRRLGALCVFGGFCDTIARRAWVEGGSFDEGSDRIGNPMGNLPELGWSGHRALHNLEVYDLSKGRWAKVLQSGANPIARFGCSVVDITEASQKSAICPTYLVMGGCTGRNNHKGTHADGTELQDPASHRIVHFQRSNSTNSSEEIVARWRIPLDSERASLTVDSAHCKQALGRLHASCRIGEHSHVFFGGGPPAWLSSSLMSLRSGLSYGKAGSPRFVNWGRPLSSYHTTDGNSIMDTEDFAYHYSRRIGCNADDSRLVPSPSLARGDCLFVADPLRSGEAFVYGGWRGDELGDCFKLLLGIERADERERYGNRAESIRRSRDGSEG